MDSYLEGENGYILCSVTWPQFLLVFLLFSAYDQWSLLQSTNVLLLIALVISPFQHLMTDFFSSSSRWKTFEVKCNQYSQRFPRTPDQLLSGRKHWNLNEMSAAEFQSGHCRKGGFRAAQQKRDWEWFLPRSQADCRRAPGSMAVSLPRAGGLPLCPWLCRGGAVFLKLRWVFQSNYWDNFPRWRAPRGRYFCW